MSASCSSGDGSSSESGEYSTEDENRPKPTVRSGIQLLRDEYSKTNQRNSNERSKYDRQSSYSKSQSQKYSRNSSHSQRSRSNSPIDRSRRNDSDSYRKSKSHRNDYRSSRYSRNSPRRRNYNDEAADSDYERNQNRYSERHYNSSWSRYDDRVKQNDGKRNSWEDDRDRKRNRDKDRDRDRRERNHSPKKRHIERSEDRSSPSRERTDKKQNKKTVEENNRKSPSPTKETSQPKNGEKETQDKDSENKDPNTPAVEESVQQPSVKKSRLEQEENITTRTGGAYIPPARLRMMQAQITDKSSIQYQRIAWEALKKSINGLINKVNVSNIAIIVRELFKENIVRGRGILARSIMQAQAASPTFTHVYAAFTAIINTKFPQIGELVLRRLIIQFRRGFKRNDKNICLSATRFLAHLVNQQVAHEVLALEILTLLLENPTDDSVEVGVGFLKECGMKLTEVSPRGIHAVFERLRSILHEGQLDKRIQYMIEVMFAIRKDNFKDHPAVIEELDMVEEQDQFTHLLTLDEATNPEDILNVFKHDPEYEENEAKYSTLRKEILDESSSGSEGEGEDGDEDGESDSEAEEGEEETKMIIDNTETNLVSLRRTIYLTIQSSLDFEECAHKILKMELKPGQEVELCHMILDCCAQQRTYEKFFGLLAQRFCQLNKIYVTPNEQIFRDSYDTIHRLETNKLRNVAKFFAHLLYTDAIGWIVLSHIRLNEEDTTSSSRIFIKILFQELSEYMGLPRLNERVKDPTLQEAFDGLFPRDNPRNTRFAINFFTSIGLGGLTDELREHLKSQPKQQVVVPPAVESESESSSSSSDDDDDDSEGSDSSSDSESDSSDSDSSSGSDSSVEVIQKKPKEAQYKNKEKKYRGKEKESKSKEKEYRKDDARPSKLHHDKRSKTSHSEHKHKHRSKT